MISLSSVAPGTAKTVESGYSTSFVQRPQLMAEAEAEAEITKVLLLGAKLKTRETRIH
jgi:hypothetical protein